MIAHISPASTCFEESRTTLIYAYRAKNIKTQVKCNLQNISRHIDQYTSIIADLHRETERLKARIKNQEKEKSVVSSHPREVQAEMYQDSEAHGRQEMNKLRAQLTEAFREQMELCHSLMELENTNIELQVDTCRHLLTIADWERKKTQHVRKSDELAKEKKDENTQEEDREVEGTDSPEPHEVMVAREEINLLLAEQRRTAALKLELEQHLAHAKKKASQMEKTLPRQITSEDLREVLRLLCRAHELEVGNTELQANTLYKENLLCQKDFVIQRLQQHTLLCEEIIQQQQTLIKAQDIPVPEMLAKLHRLHSSELEEGTLNRLLLLHSVMSSMLRPQDSPFLDLTQPLDLNKDEVRKGLPGNMKDLPCRGKFDIPSIILESDSDSYRSPKASPCRREGSLDTHLSPTFSCSSKNRVQQISKAKHGTPSSPSMDNACENHLHPARLFQLSKAAGSSPTATKVKLPVSHHSEGNPLQVVLIDNTPASTLQQSNADHAKRQVLQKQVKGPADGASSRQKQQSVTALRNQPKTK